MKKVIVLLTVLFMVCVSLPVNAQNKAKSFEGKWELTTVGSPNGDSKMMLLLEQKEGKLVGTINLHDQPVKIDQIDVKGKTANLYFVAGEYDVNITLEQKDDNTLDGSGMNGMIGIKGKRVTE